MDFARDPPSDTDEQKQKTLSHLRTAIGDSRREVKELSTDEINQVLEAEIQQNRAQAEAEEEADEETEVGEKRSNATNLNLQAKVLAAKKDFNKAVGDLPNKRRVAAESVIRNQKADDADKLAARWVVSGFEADSVTPQGARTGGGLEQNGEGSGWRGGFLSGGISGKSALQRAVDSAGEEGGRYRPSEMGGYTLGNSAGGMADASMDYTFGAFTAEKERAERARLSAVGGSKGGGRDLAESLQKVAQTGQGSANLLRDLGSWIDSRGKGREAVEPKKRAREAGETTMALLLRADDKVDLEYEEALKQVYGNRDKQQLVDALVDSDSSKNMVGLEKCGAKIARTMTRRIEMIEEREVPMNGQDGLILAITKEREGLSQELLKFNIAYNNLLDGNTPAAKAFEVTVNARKSQLQKSLGLHQDYKGEGIFNAAEQAYRACTVNNPKAQALQQAQQQQQQQQQIAAMQKQMAAQGAAGNQFQLNVPPPPTLVAPPQLQIATGHGGGQVGAGGEERFRKGAGDPERVRGGGPQHLRDIKVGQYVGERMWEDAKKGGWASVDLNTGMSKVNGDACMKCAQVGHVIRDCPQARN